VELLDNDIQTSWQSCNSGAVIDGSSIPSIYNSPYLCSNLLGLGIRLICYIAVGNTLYGCSTQNLETVAILQCAQSPHGQNACNEGTAGWYYCYAQSGGYPTYPFCYQITDGSPSPVSCDSQPLENGPCPGGTSQRYYCFVGLPGSSNSGNYYGCTPTSR